MALFISKITRTGPVLDLFVAADDAQSYIALQCTQKLLKRYCGLQAAICVHVLPPGLNGWASSFETKCKWAARDAGLLAALYGLREPSVTPRCVNTVSIQDATAKMYAAAVQENASTDITSDLNGADAVDRTLNAMHSIWAPDINSKDTAQEEPTPDPPRGALGLSQARLKKLGYYNPGALHFQGEWYPPNRLHHLELRLQCGGFDSTSSREGMLFNQEIECERNTQLHHTIVSSHPPDKERSGSPPDCGISSKESIPVELFYSFRSPYSQLILPRLKRLCAHYGRSIVVRPVLPMVSRGLKVPLEKQIYIVTDAAREARLWNIPFGNMIDPLHPNKMPYLRAFDAYGVALQYGKEYEFLESYGECQWGSGISAGTDAGLRTMLLKANMYDRWEEVRAVIYSESDEEKFNKWETITASNRDYLLNNGLWGVPCVRYRDTIVFGQDKLWAIKMILESEHRAFLGGNVASTTDSLINSNSSINIEEESDRRLVPSIKKYCSH